MSRERLPDRRPNATETIAWAGHDLHITIGFARDGRSWADRFAAGEG